MTPTDVDALIDEVKASLKGIDADDFASPGGWWPTSIGAEFGAAKLAALESLLRERLSDPIPCRSGSGGRRLRLPAVEQLLELVLPGRVDLVPVPRQQAD